MSFATSHPALFEQATALYRSSGEFAWRFARGKFGGDPVFAGLLRHGLIPARSRVLDIGCGQGLLAALLYSIQSNPKLLQEWPVDWAPAPVGIHLRGIELMPRDVQRARRALAPLESDAEITQGDMCKADFGQTDVAVLLDVLHYVDYDAQHDILRRVNTALSAEGRLLLRVGNAAAGLPFQFSNWVDMLVTLVRRQRWIHLYCRSLKQWLGVLAELGFKVETLTMDQGTPFANVLLIASPVKTAQARP